MDIYHFLSTIIAARKKYAVKFFLIALPVLLLAAGELILLVLTHYGWIKVPLGYMITVIVILLLSEAFAMFYFFDRLVEPLRLSKDALISYMRLREIPQLPYEYDDEAGLLMRNISATIVKMDDLITEKTDMIDLLSHDMRSPVGRIISLSNLIKSENGSEKNVYADFIVNECTNLLRVLENILIMLREEGNDFKLVSVNLKQVVTETIRFFDLAAHSKGLQLNIEVDESLYVNVQHDLFTQAVRNVIGNAIKFSPEGKSIHIFTKEYKDKISLTVKDEGMGLAPADVNKIFERFTHAGKKGTHGESSTGLGLYLSRKIIEKHGGKLMAESEGLNKGSSFTIVLQQLIPRKAAVATAGEVDQQGELFKK